jgi:hypothetical protein
MQKKIQFLQIKPWFYPTLRTRHHRWRTWGPLPYNLNLSTIKLTITEFCWTSYDWVLQKAMNNPNVTSNIVPSLGSHCSYFPFI